MRYLIKNDFKLNNDINQTLIIACRFNDKSTIEYLINKANDAYEL